jgi:lysophospholipase L1-like esterase
MTPPPFDAAAWRKARNVHVDDRQNDVARSYGDKVKEVAQEHHCILLDVWETLQGGTSPEHYGKYLSDGLHLNEQGNRQLHQGLMNLIRNEHPDLAPAAMEGQTNNNVGIPLEEKPWTELC